MKFWCTSEALQPRAIDRQIKYAQNSGSLRLSGWSLPSCCRWSSFAYILDPTRLLLEMSKKADSAFLTPSSQIGHRSRKSKAYLSLLYAQPNYGISWIHVNFHPKSNYVSMYMICWNLPRPIHTSRNDKSRGQITPRFFQLGHVISYTFQYLCSPKLRVSYFYCYFCYKMCPTESMLLVSALTRV